MTWDEMDCIKRSRQFERLKELFFDALGELWSKDFAEVKTVFEPRMQPHFCAQFRADFRADFRTFFDVFSQIWLCGNK